MTAPRHLALPRGRRRGTRRISRDILRAFAETSPTHRKDPS